MALKINEDTQRTAYHVNDGPTVMYKVDANSAVSRHPDEWSLTPWSPEDAAAARKRLHERRVAEARAAGEDEPGPLIEPELNDADRAEFEEWRKNRDAARERLAKIEKEDAERRDREAQIEADRAIVASSPPQPDPRRKPLMGAAKAAADRKAAKDAQAAADKAAADKKAADQSAKVTADNASIGKPKAVDES